MIEAGGETAIRTNTIAAECGVTPPILYRAFANRDGLVIAAQAERYRRSSSSAAEFLISHVANANSRDELRANLSETLDFIFSPSRAAARRLRAEVIGCAVSRPALREAIVRVDTEYADRIASAYEKATSAGWTAPGTDMRAVALWAQGLITSMAAMEFGHDADSVEKWTEVARAAVLRAVLGD
ncbi:MAG: hypothetical protein RLZZ305_821 [Actinomycetota bacterium]